MNPRIDMRCACCGGTDWTPHRYTDDIDYLACTRCHYAVQARRSSDDLSHRFEAEQQKFYDEGSLFLSDDFSTVNSETTQRRLSYIRKYLPGAASLVEVGPGSGDLICRLAALGYSATAVEHSELLANRLRQRAAITVLCGDFSEQPLPQASFDAYCSFHVIEHVIDFKRHLAAACAWVRPGGYAFIATPNAHGWEHRLPFGLSPNYDSSHFQLFSAEALRLALRESGWQVAAIATPSYALAWLRVITKVLRRLRGQDEDTTGGQYARSMTRKLRIAVAAFTALTLPLRRLQELLRGGNELLVIARRPAVPAAS